MPDAVKPEICLTGKLLYPVHIGLPAYIQETDGYRRTSAVCAILADTQEATVIETRNSVYLAMCLTFLAFFVLRLVEVKG